MKKDLFTELAVEEIPSSMARGISLSFSQSFEKHLLELAIGFGKIERFHTPRRFVLLVSGIEPKQKDKTVESFGPSESAAFDKNGSPTAAAIGFARSKGVEVKNLEIAEREKGRFLVFRQTIKGKSSAQAIAEKFPAILEGIQCPKSMRWGANAVFARPIRKAACFYGGKPLKLETNGIPFSTKVSGHRFAGGKPFKPDGWKSYLAELKKRFVIVDPDEREEIIEKEVRSVTKKLGGVFRRDKELLETVGGLVEYPLVLSGSFEKQFLNLPEETLTSVMKNHQKYFPVFSKSGGLMPHFVFVCGTPATNPETVIKGNERVLRARFADAEFFHGEDLKKPLESRLKDLDSTVFLSGAGSYGDKTARLEKIVEKLAEQTGGRRLSKKLKRAARLSKADLATQMVFEIPELQGTMGKHYSKAGGEEEEVSTAIGEQYMPTARDSALPATNVGALLAIADKMDNICVCFYLGMKPTGSSDPFALRRQAIGLIQIALAKEKEFDFSVAGLSDFILKLLEKADYSAAPSADIKDISGEINRFLAGRFRTIMAERGAKPDSVEAVAAAGFDNIGDCKNRLDAIEDARKSASFTALASSFKRVVNILGDGKERKVDPKLFENDEEKNLWEKLSEIEKKSETADLRSHLEKIATLGKSVDAFFDGTMVMHKNARIRKNRLALLGRIKDLFFRVGDLSRIETPKE